MRRKQHWLLKMPLKLSPKHDERNDDRLLDDKQRPAIGALKASEHPKLLLLQHQDTLSHAESKSLGKVLSSQVPSWNTRSLTSQHQSIEIPRTHQNQRHKLTTKTDVVAPISSPSTWEFLSSWMSFSCLAGVTNKSAIKGWFNKYNSRIRSGLWSVFVNSYRKCGPSN